MASSVSRRCKVNLKDLNSWLTCTLCGGYFIDATTLVDCLHVFCRGCILKHFDNESAKQECPTCKKKKICFRPDPQMQALVYKMVPGLYQKEMQRREDFYRSTGVRASSSCSDDSILGDLKQDQEKWMLRNADYTLQFYSPDDSISLSLEYYQHHLDETSTDSTKKPSAISASDSDSKSVVLKSGGDKRKMKCEDKEDKVRDRRYLQCPAAVSMSHLQKFLRMKYALSPEHKVDIIYEGEVLPSHFNLMDVAYTFNWSKIKPMRFFYRIFTPMKIQPIKIINTSSTGGKQLQIVPVKPNPDPKPPALDTIESQKSLEREEGRDNKSKERLMAHLKLQSKHKTDEAKIQEANCVYEYEEPDKEEIKRFAENRDREWARMRSEEIDTHHVSKKRKKNKHSRGDVKKRKIHAEITSEVKQESIKLKVKLHNGHKHKHRLPQIIEPPSIVDVGNKEKLLQMRSVRHKKEEKSEEVVKVEEKKEEPAPLATASSKLRSDFTIKPLPNVGSVEISEKDKKAQQTFLKTFQSSTERVNKPAEKIAPVKIEKAVEKKPLNTYSNPNQNKSLERKIASLQQQCTTIEPKVDKKFSNDKPHILNTHMQPTGFTVSKIETGKRKAEEENTQDNKRPSLEITLIKPTDPPKPAKRPPPATIPLDRIKKSGINIMSKLPEKCDNVGPLDLSKPHKLDIPVKSNGITTLNGIKDLKSLNLPKVPDKNNTPLSNLQMLSKVASEHSILTKPNNNNNKVRPEMPNLTTIKIPTPPNKAPALPKLHKLNEINKSQFRILNNTHVRNMRPSQNQQVRSIPNPSLLVNRLNAQNGDNKEPKILNTLAKENNKEEKKSTENGTGTTSVSS